MFTIGEFSKFCCISARMLRHYDHIGLLHPAATDEQNGYRYYDSSQITTFQRIEKLKRYGFSLAEIKRLLTLTEAELNIQILLQYERVKEQAASLTETLTCMERDISHFKEGITMNRNYHIIVMNTPEQRVFSVKRTIAIRARDIHGLISDLMAQAKERGLHRTGPCQLVYMGSEFNEDMMEVEAQLQVAEAHPDTKLLPDSLSVTTIHQGPLEEIHTGYQAICQYLDEHPEYQLTGISIERYLKDETMVSSAEELETAILFPVVKA